MPNPTSGIIKVAHPCQLYEGQTADHTFGIDMEWVLVNLLGVEPGHSIRVVVTLVVVNGTRGMGGQFTDTDTHPICLSVLVKLENLVSHNPCFNKFDSLAI